MPVMPTKVERILVGRKEGAFFQWLKIRAGDMELLSCFKTRHQKDSSLCYSYTVDGDDVVMMVVVPVSGESG